MGTYMKINCRVAVASVLALVSAAVHGESQFSTALAVLADEEGGRSADLDVSFAPNPSWTLDAGFGSTKARSDVADIDGESLRAALDVHSERFGLRGYYRSYSDSNSFETDTIGVRGSVRSGNFGFSLMAETREFDVEYTSGSVPSPKRGMASFDGNGYGAGMSYVAAGWGVYAEALFYDFGSQLEDYETVAEGPTSLGVPIVQGLTGVQEMTSSIIAFKQGALDRQFGAGVERGFERSSIRFDWAGVEDAISGAKSNSFSAGYRYSFIKNANIGVTLGVTDSDFGSVNFAGASLGFSL